MSDYPGVFWTSFILALAAGTTAAETSAPPAYDLVLGFLISIVCALVVLTVLEILKKDHWTMSILKGWAAGGGFLMAGLAYLTIRPL